MRPTRTSTFMKSSKVIGALDAVEVMQPGSDRGGGIARLALVGPGPGAPTGAAAVEHGLPEGSEGRREAAEILGPLENALAPPELAVEPGHGARQKRIVVLEPRFHGVRQDD